MDNWILRRKTAAIIALIIFSAVPIYIAQGLSYKSTVGVDFTINPSLTVSLSSADLIIDGLAPGVSADSNEITVTVTTNAAYGYKLSATTGSAENASRNLLHEGGTATFASIAFQSDPQNYLSSLASDNTWGYSVDSGASYNGLPLYTDTQNVATLLSSDSMPSGGSASTTFLIGAKAAETQVAGDYTNVVNFSAVTNYSPKTLREAYMANGKQLFNGYYKLQDMSSTICGMTDIKGDGSAIQLIDVRDKEVYWVTKLEDGNCWLLENLRLDLLAEDASINITAANTNASVTALSALFNGGGTSPHTATAISATWAESYNIPRIDTASKNLTTGSEGVTSSDSLDAQGQSTTWKFGIYYNYCAASAGSYCYSSDSSDGNTSEDICPSGWRMPTGGSINTTTGTGEYQALYNKYNNYTNFRNALRLPLAGRFLANSTKRNQGLRAYIWSSTMSNSNKMFDLLSASTINPQDMSFRYNGFSIRCIAQGEEN